MPKKNESGLGTLTLTAIVLAFWFASSDKDPTNLHNDNDYRPRQKVGYYEDGTPATDYTPPNYNVDDFYGEPEKRSWSLFKPEVKTEIYDLEHDENDGWDMSEWANDFYNNDP